MHLQRAECRQELFWREMIMGMLKKVWKDLKDCFLKEAVECLWGNTSYC